MILTPVATPPASREVTDLSDLAVKVLDFLKKEAEEELRELEIRPSLEDGRDFTKIKTDVVSAWVNILGPRKSGDSCCRDSSPQVVSEYFHRKGASLKHPSSSFSKGHEKSPTKTTLLFPEPHSTTAENSSEAWSSTPIACPANSGTFASKSLRTTGQEVPQLSSVIKLGIKKKSSDAISFGRLMLKYPGTAPSHSEAIIGNDKITSFNVSDDSPNAANGNGESARKNSPQNAFPSLPPRPENSARPLASTFVERALPASGNHFPSKSSRTEEPKSELHRLEKMSDHVQELTANVVQSLSLFNIVEICFTISYTEGFSLLNTPTKGTKFLCAPNGILLKITSDGSPGLREYFFLCETKLREDLFKDFLLNLLNIKCWKVCYDSQAFIIYVIDKAQILDKKVSYDWLIIDPMLAFWLIDTDAPPMTFQNMVNTLSGIIDPSCDSKNPCRLLDCLSRVIEVLFSKLNKLGLWNVFIHLETKITPIIAVMECASISIDYSQLDSMSVLLAERMKSLEKLAWQLSEGNHFNLNSNVQLARVLYDELKLDVKAGISVPATGRTKVKSTAEATLKLLGQHHKLPKVVMEFRRLQKIKSAYVDGIAARVINKKYISTTWEQCAAATGRLVSNGPNLQAIPKTPVSFEDTHIEMNLRKPYRPRSGFLFVAADFKQIELRIIAHLSKDARLMEAFEHSDDVFASITRMRLAKAEISPDERNQTKTLVYALMYGAGMNKITDILSLDKEVAVITCERLYTLFPQLKQFRQRVIQECREKKYLTSIGGRRRLFPQINYSDPKIRFRTERQAVNFIIQGSAADVCKAAMVSAEYALRKHGVNSRLLLQIHDELLWEVPNNDVDNTKALIKETIEAKSTEFFRKMSLGIHLPVKISSGVNWGEMED